MDIQNLEDIRKRLENSRHAMQRYTFDPVYSENGGIDSDAADICDRLTNVINYITGIMQREYITGDEIKTLTEKIEDVLCYVKIFTASFDYTIPLAIRQEENLHDILDIIKYGYADTNKNRLPDKIRRIYRKYLDCKYSILRKLGRIN